MNYRPISGKTVSKYNKMELYLELLFLFSLHNFYSLLKSFKTPLSIVPSRSSQCIYTLIMGPRILQKKHPRSLSPHSAINLIIGVHFGQSPNSLDLSVLTYETVMIIPAGR